MKQKYKHTKMFLNFTHISEDNPIYTHRNKFGMLDVIFKQENLVLNAHPSHEPNPNFEAYSDLITINYSHCSLFQASMYFKH